MGAPETIRLVDVLRSPKEEKLCKIEVINGGEELNATETLGTEEVSGAVVSWTTVKEPDTLSEVISRF